MRALSAHEILRLYDYGQNHLPAERAVALLALACPEVLPEDLVALPIGERDARLLAVRDMTLGPRLEGFAECPRCGQALEFTLATPDLRDAAGAPLPPEQRVLDYRGFHVRFRLLTSHDLAEAAAVADPSRARRLLVERCVVSAQRRGRDVMVAALPDALVARLATRLAEGDPGAEMLFDLRCAGCGHGWQAVFDIATFFWSELLAHARRLLREVHQLATAYGWSEAEILSLGGRRRQAYLEMAGA
jgi:hypothetical protein